MSPGDDARRAAVRFMQDANLRRRGHPRSTFGDFLKTFFICSDVIEPSGCLHANANSVNDEAEEGDVDFLHGCLTAFQMDEAGINKEFSYADKKRIENETPFEMDAMKKEMMRACPYFPTLRTLNVTVVELERCVARHDKLVTNCGYASLLLSLAALRGEVGMSIYVRIYAACEKKQTMRWIENLPSEIIVSMIHEVLLENDSVGIHVLSFFITCLHPERHRDLYMQWIRTGEILVCAGKFRNPTALKWLLENHVTETPERYIFDTIWREAVKRRDKIVLQCMQQCHEKKPSVCPTPDYELLFHASIERDEHLLHWVVRNNIDCNEIRQWDPKDKRYVHLPQSTQQILDHWQNTLNPLPKVAKR
jgi:hypothetical protein